MDFYIGVHSSCAAIQLVHLHPIFTASCSLITAAWRLLGRDKLPAAPLAVGKRK